MKSSKRLKTSNRLLVGNSFKPRSDYPKNLETVFNRDTATTYVFKYLKNCYLLYIYLKNHLILVIGSQQFGVNCIIIIIFV